MPPSSPNLEMVISERPIYPTPEAYEPIPLEQLEDLEAMPSSGIMETKPIYIVNPLKGDQNISGEILPPTEEEVEEALMQANIGTVLGLVRIGSCTTPINSILYTSFLL